MIFLFLFVRHVLDNFRALPRLIRLKFFLDEYFFLTAIQYMNQVSVTPEQTQIATCPCMLLLFLVNHDPIAFFGINR